MDSHDGSTDEGEGRGQGTRNVTVEGIEHYLVIDPNAATPRGIRVQRTRNDGSIQTSNIRIPVGAFYRREHTHDRSELKVIRHVVSWIEHV